MGSLTQALSIALSGLQTSTSLISLTSKNISNANTAGYTTKSASVESVDFGSTFGGVGIASYSRASDTALTQDYNLSTSTASYSNTQNKYMTQVQNILDSTASNPTLSADVANFASAWTQYVSNPENSSAQQQVISSGKTLVNDIHTTAAGIGALKSQVISDTSDNVATFNNQLKQIATLNKQIQQATTSNQPTVDLQDQLDTAVNKLSSFAQVSVQSRANGQIAVYTPSGQVLVDEQSSKSFNFNGSSITDNNGTDVTSALSGGSLQAATDFISSSASAASSTIPGVGTIAKFQAQISKLADAFTSGTSSFATAYTNAVTSSTAVGATQASTSVASSFFTVSLDANNNPDASTLDVNSALTNGTSVLPQSNVQGIANSFTTTNNYTASGLTANSVTYAGLTTAILSRFQQDANTISTQSTTASTQQSYYQTTLSNKTGVNTDTELANLVAYQNSYAASAHVISTVNQMLSTLMQVL